MNFSQVIEQGEVAVELKYCERCGGLWLRRTHEDGSYCERCRAAVAAWPRTGRGRKKLSRGRITGFAQVRQREREGNAFAAEQYVIDTLLGMAEAVRV
jgi:Zn-finger nucleic acid-binding protein